MKPSLLLQNNKFANCSKEELETLWKGLIRFYDTDKFEEDNPITPYKEVYTADGIVGLVNMEWDLLRKIVLTMLGPYDDEDSCKGK